MPSRAKLGTTTLASTHIAPELTGAVHFNKSVAVPSGTKPSPKAAFETRGLGVPKVLTASTVSVPALVVTPI